MTKNPLVIGQRYKLEHGTGIYIGYEQFFDNGKCSKIIKTAHRYPESQNRRVFDLDPGHTWCSTGYYCEWPRGIRDVDL